MIWQGYSLSDEPPFWVCTKDDWSIWFLNDFGRVAPVNSGPGSVETVEIQVVKR